MNSKLDKKSLGKIEALKYALDIVQGRRILNRPPPYLAALDEIQIFLKAALERVELGQEMHSTCVVESQDTPGKRDWPSGVL